VNNGSLHYDHDNDGTDINLGGCESPFRGRDTDTHVAVRYQNDTLTVSTDIDGKNSWTECFSLNNIQLPTHYYFGFSAATGELSDNHDIISVHTYQLDSSEERKQADRKHILPAAPSATVGETVVTSSQTSGSSALKIFFIVIGVILLCLGGVGIYYYINNRKRGPRFY
jgi:mannose-binding lectin 2